MVNHEHVYNELAGKYDLLISRQADILDIIESIRPIEGLDVIDLGAGSGRLTSVLAPRVKSVLALDSSVEMLKINAKKLNEKGLSNWKTQVADHRRIPVEDHSIDLIVAGWTICYVGSSNVSNNEQNIENTIQEMKRVLRPNGTIIIFETLGTGYKEPNPPDYLKQYYFLLEDQYKFLHQWIRLDYQFKNLKEAEDLTRFFFGDKLANRVVKERLVHLPECTGIWWLTK
ncbi:Methyltransferase domain-containing protein [Seinonella peptonophila]|uniref:Methyltransferase domain-containing protein n=1 Tax=Seinonella peptonophila TaxID=112248 RepID=A0A1M5AW48_9BACL|nr:class I SAM-dependent methyltransferase [Seinonella peptonophila]SHF34449.1 Methyltransferase domain-containing protein [Seinonella peptonophila]